jgi:hypothetical protein
VPLRVHGHYTRAEIEAAYCFSSRRLSLRRSLRLWRAQHRIPLDPPRRRARSPSQRHRPAVHHPAQKRGPLLPLHPLPRPGPWPIAVPLGKPEHHHRRLPHQPAHHPPHLPRIKGAVVPLRGSLRRGYSSAHFATLTGMLGLSGFTSTLCSCGRSTRSMSSIGIAPSSTSLPSTIAPVKQRRLRNRTSTGPT